MSTSMPEQAVFAEYFAALTGYPPLRWQGRLFSRLVKGEIPKAVDLPTGLGKTSVIPVWLIAVAFGASGNAGRIQLPRRLVYIVNRRTVVDQATDIVEGMRQRLSTPDDPRWTSQRTRLEDLAQRLRSLSAGNGEGPPFAVSTLRGELADNEEWKIDPARPAVIVGTVDMIGSKLLFSGYGDGHYLRAHHAGLLGQDALIVHDEAHLSPAFGELLEAIEQEQRRCRDPRPLRVMSLSATRRGSGPDTAGFGLEEEDLRDLVVQQRIAARKRLQIVEADKPESRIAEIALEHGRNGSRILVYVQSPEAAQEVTKNIINGLTRETGGKLHKDQAARRVGLLTGTIRGYERDRLASSELFRAFQSDARCSGNSNQTDQASLFLVSTSAGEVGVDWNADHLVCDLTTLDGMIQRFGRVNRLGVDRHGQSREATITVVTGKEPQRKNNSLTTSLEKTLQILREAANSDGDVSPAGLEALRRRILNGSTGGVGRGQSQAGTDGGPAVPASGPGDPAARPATRPLGASDWDAAFSPPPQILAVSDILFDKWSLTSITDEMPGQPAVAGHLHGVGETEPSDTHVAWRADISLLASAGGTDERGQPIPCSEETLWEVFEAFPLRSIELLRDRTDRVQKELVEIGRRLDKIVGSAPTAVPSHRTETPVGEEPASQEFSSDDVAALARRLPADPWVVLLRGSSVRWVRLSDAYKEEARSLLAFATLVLPVEVGGLNDGMLAGEKPPPPEPAHLDVAEIDRAGVPSRRRFLVTPQRQMPLMDKDESWQGVTLAAVDILTAEGEDSGQLVLEYRVARGTDREPGVRLPLDDHCRAVCNVASRMAAALGLDGDEARALQVAARWHDAGKARPVWQRYARNTDPSAAPLAKSDRYLHWKALGGYRHEFGSLVDALADAEIQQLDPHVRDLALHLIASHHGWGRPHFEPRHFDRGDASGPRPTAENEAIAVEVIQRFGRLQHRFGRWGLAWLEAILRCADALASRQAVLASIRSGGAEGSQS